MNKNELHHALVMKDKLNKVGSGFCLAKWDQVTMHLHNGMTHSCHHPAPHKIPLEEISQNYKAIHNSREKIAERKAMLNGERPGPCNFCYKMEDSNKEAVSDRYLKSANLFADRFDTIVQSGTGDDHTPQYVEVSFSNACNLKCTYCGPHFSSKWQQEQQQNEPIMLTDAQSKQSTWDYHSLGYLESINELPMPHNQNNPYVDAFWKWWPDLRKTLKTLRVTGGEPLMSRDTFKLLSEIEKHPMPDLELGINTNLNAPEQAWQKLIEFIKKNEQENLVKKITLYTSLDGWGKQAEYIRSGLDFNMLWDRLLYLIETHPTVDNTIMTAYSVLSVPSYGKFLEKILEIKKSKNRYNGRFTQYSEFFLKNNLIDDFVRGDKPCAVHVDISPITFPPFLSLATPPRELVMPYAWNQYDFMMQNLTAGQDNRAFYDYEAEKMGRVVDSCYYGADDDNAVHRANFRKFIGTIDSRRNTKFIEVFPELEEYYRKCYA